MLKYHNIISFSLSLILLILLQWFATPAPVFRFLAPAFLVYVAVVAAYNRWYLTAVGKYNFWTVLRSVMLLMACFGIFLLLPSALTRTLFLTVSVVLITFFQAVLGKAAENILLNETLFIAFGLFCAWFGFYYDAPSYEPIYIAGTFFSAFLLGRSLYEFVPKPKAIKIISAISLGLFCAEIYWCLNFLQFHFSSLALILFNIFYFCLIVSYYHFYQTLNFKKIKFHLFLMLACVAVVLVTTRWSIAQ